MWQVRPPPATVYSGPTFATVADREAHTLPVGPVVPLHASLTLNDFEDVLAEAIYFGSAAAPGTGASAASGSAPLPQHPKEEARARIAHAKARQSASLDPGYFTGY